MVFLRGTGCVGCQRDAHRQHLHRLKHRVQRPQHDGADFEHLPRAAPRRIRTAVKRGLCEWRVRRTTRLRLRDRTSRLYLVAGRAEHALLVVHLHAELTRPADGQRPGLEHYLLIRIGRDDEHALVLPRVSRPVRACVVYARAQGRWRAGRTR